MNYKKDLPVRKPNRLKEFDYNQNGAYFVTICTKDRKCILSNIVGDGVFDVPKIYLSKYGKIVKNRIDEMNIMYDNIFVEKYIIMPNHIHLVIRINNITEIQNGTSRTASPTNSTIPLFVSTFKRLTNKQIGNKIWQRSYHDHIIREEEDYINICEYINNNALKWQDDKYFNGGNVNG